MRRLVWATLLVALLQPGLASSQTYSIPFADIQQLIDESGASPDAAIKAYLAGLIKDELDALGFDTAGGLVLDAIPLDPIDYIFQTNCNLPQPFQVRTAPTEAEVSFSSDSGLTLSLDTIRSISLHADLDGSAYTYAPAEVLWGQDIIFIGDCVKFETDHGWVALTQPFNIDLDLAVTLNPTYDADQIAIVVDKHATLSGLPQVSGGTLQHNFGSFSLTDLLIDIFEDNLLEELQQNAEQTLADEIVALNFRLDGRDENGVIDPGIVAFNGPTVFALDVDPEDQGLVSGLLAELGVPDFLIDMLDERGVEILLQLAILEGDEREAFLAELGATASCDVLLNTFEATLASVPLYEFDGQSCNVADLDGADAGHYFTDMQCVNEVAYRPRDDVEFCATRFGAQSEVVLGNAASWTPDLNQANDEAPGIESREWTRNASTNLDLGVLSLLGNQQPFIKQLNYKTISGVPRGTGLCELEMRVYKSDITAQDLNPLVVFHGGTWRHRGFSFYGLEAAVSQFTERGFVVFAPFYRLTGESDGNVECNGASWREVIEDAESALDWVRANGADYGARSEPASVFGQSAGAHLAAWLGVHRSADVRKALMFYAPTDVLEFLGGAIPPGGPYEGYRGSALTSLSRFFGARNGGLEVRLDLIDYATLTPAMLSDNPDSIVPDAVFDFSLVDPLDAPYYLARCADEMLLDLGTINLLGPPPELLSCLKAELAEFLVNNSFNHLLVDEPVPMHFVHGSADSLVPYVQPLNACAAIDGNPQPATLTAPLTSYACGRSSEVQIIRDAEHALELGICVDSLCPGGAPGSEHRAATETAITLAYDWLAHIPRANFKVDECRNPIGYAPVIRCRGKANTPGIPSRKLRRTPNAMEQTPLVDVDYGELTRREFRQKDQPEAELH